MVRYRDENGNLRTRVIKDSSCKHHDIESGHSESDNNSSSGESSEDDVSADLQEYAHRDGPKEESESESVYDKYNISDEEDFENAEVYHEGDDRDSSSVDSPHSHPYAADYSQSYAASESHENQKHSSKSSKSPKKIVYVYKQPPIIVKQKPTNVYIRSKPIVVQPPPLVVHHPQPKPCKQVIKYQPPNIKLRPVIVKISKPKTTKATPCTTTTKKPRRKCKKTKPTKANCNPCNRWRTIKNSNDPEDMSVYLSHHHEPKHQRRSKYSEGVLT